MKVPRLLAMPRPVWVTTLKTPIAPISAETATSTHVAVMGVAYLRPSRPRISGISSSFAIA